jgi:hypothetical protein
VVKEYGESLVESHLCSVKKYSIYFESPHINLISLVQFLVIGAMLISQKIFYRLGFVFFKMEKMIVQILKYLKCDVQHETEKYVGAGIVQSV